MDLNPKIKLPDELVGRCKAFGYQVVKSYTAGRNPNSLAVSSHGAQFNVDLQAKAKMAECAFCLWAGQEPAINLHWDRDRCDPGYDVLFRGLRCDIKSVEHYKKFLIWPFRKVSIFDSKPFDVLVLVKERAPLFWISGWITKADFKRTRYVAGATHALTHGTWYLYEECLSPMCDLLRARAA